jgi:hypothetical protein
MFPLDIYLFIFFHWSDIPRVPITLEKLNHSLLCEELRAELSFFAVFLELVQIGGVKDRVQFVVTVYIRYFINVENLLINLTACQP